MKKTNRKKSFRKKTKTKKMIGGNSNGFTLVGFILPEGLGGNPFPIISTEKRVFVPVAGMIPIFLPNYFRYYGDLYDVVNEQKFRSAIISGKPTILFLPNIYNLGIRGIDLLDLAGNNVYFIDDYWKGANLLDGVFSPGERAPPRDASNYNLYVKKLYDNPSKRRAILNLEMSYPSLFKRIFTDENYTPESELDTEKFSSYESDKQKKLEQFEAEKNARHQASLDAILASR